MRRAVVRGTATLIVLALTACSRGETAVAGQPSSSFRITATIQDIMDSEIDPAADYLWGAVGSTVSASGVQDRQPASEEDWREARHRALILVEAPNLLMMEGRQVAGKRPLKDAATPGVATPAEIAHAIEKNRARFIGFARGLQNAGLAALAAIDAKDADALMQAGARLDDACESCHLQYWYPNAPRPPEPTTVP